MADTNIPQDWEGQQIVYELDSNQNRGRSWYQGVLEAVGALGLTVREDLALPYGELDNFGQPEGYNHREVPVFYPWHRVRFVRLAEPEEKQMPEAEASDEAPGTRTARAVSIRPDN